MARTVLRAEDLEIGYSPASGPRSVVAQDLEVELYRGELVGLLGPNGAGKSTLLRTLAGLQRPLAGRIWLDGCDLRRLSPRSRARRLSVVLSERGAATGLSARSLVALGRQPHTGWWGRLLAEDLERVSEALEAVGASDLADRPVAELSDGEQQRVLIARALAQDTAVLVMDEPTAYLDLPHRVELLRRLRDLARETGQAVLLSTHDLDLALRCADRLWLLPRVGSLQAGAPEDLVLSGALQRIFDGQSVSFDPRSGSFALNAQPAGKIGLSGTGLPFLWTRRALERAGFRTSTEDARAHIDAEQVNGTTHWVLHGFGAPVRCESVYQLLIELREQHSRQIAEPEVNL